MGRWTRIRKGEYGYEDWIVKKRSGMNQWNVWKGGEKLVKCVRTFNEGKLLVQAFKHGWTQFRAVDGWGVENYIDLLTKKPFLIKESAIASVKWPNGRIDRVKIQIFAKGCFFRYKINGLDVWVPIDREGLMFKIWRMEPN